MRNQYAFVRELYCITDVVNKFKHYFVCYKFIICTDQQALQHLSTQAIQTIEQQKWLPRLLGYDFSIKYKHGKDNHAVGALSRR